MTQVAIFDIRNTTIKNAEDAINSFLVGLHVNRHAQQHALKTYNTLLEYKQTVTIQSMVITENILIIAYHTEPEKKPA